MLFVLYRGDEIDGAAIAAFSVVLFDEDAVCTVDFNDGLPDELPKADRVYIVGTGYDWPSIERVCADAKAVVLFEHGYKQHYLLDNIEQHLSRVDNIVIAYGRIEDQPGMGVVTSFIKFCEGSLCNPAKALLKRFRNEGLISLINDYSKGIRDDEINEFVTGLRLTADAKLADMPQLKPSKALIVVLGRLCVASLSLTQICDEGYKKIKGLYLEHSHFFLPIYFLKKSRPQSYVSSSVPLKLQHQRLCSAYVVKPHAVHRK